MESGYQGQFERMKRYLKRFNKINNGILYDQSSLHYCDDIYAFFQNCYHLKDWIKNDPTCSNWCCIETFINSNKDLQICADLCNGLKHLQLNKPRSNKNPKFSGSNISLNINEGFSGITEPEIAISYKITTALGDIDAFNLAQKCVDAWEIYIGCNTSSS